MYPLLSKRRGLPSLPCAAMLFAMSDTGAPLAHVASSGRYWAPMPPSNRTLPRCCRKFAIVDAVCENKDADVAASPPEPHWKNPRKTKLASMPARSCSEVRPSFAGSVALSYTAGTSAPQFWHAASRALASTPVLTAPTRLAARDSATKEIMPRLPRNLSSCMGCAPLSGRLGAGHLRFDEAMGTERT